MREAAARAFSQLQRLIGSAAITEIVPSLLQLKLKSRETMRKMADLTATKRMKDQILKKRIPQSLNTQERQGVTVTLSSLGHKPQQTTCAGTDLACAGNGGTCARIYSCARAHATPHKTKSADLALPAEKVSLDMCCL